MPARVRWLQTASTPSITLSRESIKRDDLDAHAPRVRLGGEPGFEDLFGASRDHVQKPGGSAAVADGHQVHDDGDVRVAIGGAATRAHPRR